MSDLAKQGRAERELVSTAPTIHRPAAESVRIERADDGAWIVIGRQAERAVALNDLTDLEALAYVHDRLRGLGVDRKLERAGVKAGDTVVIGALEFEWDEGGL